MRLQNKWLVAYTAIGLAMVMLVVQILTLRAIYTLQNRPVYVSEYTGTSSTEALLRMIGEMERANSWLIVESISCVDPGSTLDNLLVKVNWLLKDVRADEQIGLLYKASRDTEWLRAAAHRHSSDANAFLATMALDPNHEYSFRVEATSPVGTRSSEVRSIPQEYFKAPAFILSLRSATSYGATGLSKFSYIVTQQGLPQFSVHRVRSMEVHYYADESLRSTATTQLEVAEGNTEQRYVRWVMSIEVQSSITSVVVVATMADGSTRNIATLSNLHHSGVPTIIMH